MATDTGEYREAPIGRVTLRRHLAWNSASLDFHGDPHEPEDHEVFLSPAELHELAAEASAMADELEAP